MLYTATGGLKATFLTDYLHTAVALILIIYFTLSILTNEAIGGLGGLWEKIMATAPDNKISGNYEGSLLTMKSQGAIIWGLILKFGNLALVVMVSIQMVSFHTPLADIYVGHCLLAEIFCNRSQSYSSRLQSRRLSYLRHPLGLGNRHRPFRSRYPRHSHLPHLPRHSHLGRSQRWSGNALRHQSSHR